MATNTSYVVGTATGGSAYTSGALREDLANFISNISREETPFLSSIGTDKSTNPKHEWQTDTLRTPAANRVSEGFTFGDTINGVAGATNVTTQRLNNFTQIYGEQVDIGGSLLKSDPAGAANWFAYSIKKRGLEMRRDVEFQAIRYDEETAANASNVTKSAGGSGNTDSRQMGSVYSYANNYVPVATAGGGSVRQLVVGGTNTNLTTTAGVGFNLQKLSEVASSTVIPADGTVVVNYTTTPTAGVLDLAGFNSLLQTIYVNGGKPNMAMVPPAYKAQFSNLLIAGNGGAAERRATEMSKRLNIAVDSVLTEFGFDIHIAPNYVMNDSGADNTVLVYDTSAIKKAIMTPVTIRDDQQGRYGKAAIMFEECTLEVRNPNSIGVAIGVRSIA